MVLSASGIEREEIMIDSIGNPDIRNPSCHIIPQRLIGNGLIQGHFRGFALNEQSKSAVVGGCSNIRALGKSVHKESFFYAYQTGCHSMVCKQPVDNMLPDPFFRGKAHIFFSDCVENIVFLPVSLESVIERRKVERREQPQV